MQLKKGKENPLTGKLNQNRETIAQLANSGEAKRLMELLNRQGGVREAANAAASGDASALMGMMEQLMKSDEGAALVDRIGAKAKQAGLK